MIEPMKWTTVGRNESSSTCHAAKTLAWIGGRGSRSIQFVMLLMGVVLIPSRMCHAQSDVADRRMGQAMRIKLVQLCRQTKTPGLVAGVFDRTGEEIEIWEFGWRDAQGKASITRQDHFRIASVSKLFVGHAVLRLINENKLELDQTLNEFHPSYPNADRISLSMLGHHTSGISNPIADEHFQQQILDAPDKIWSLEELVATAKSMPPANQPGTGWHYSNANTVLLAEVAQRATGQPIERLLQNLVFDPLKISKTAVTPNVLPSPSPHGYRHGRLNRWIGFGDHFVEVTFAGTGWSGPAGYLSSTIDDLADAVPSLVMGDGLSDAVIAELHNWVATDRRENFYGFHVQRRGPWLGHCGDVPGFNAAVWYHPDRQRTVIALANLSNAVDGTMPAEAAAELICRELEESSSSQ